MFVPKMALAIMLIVGIVLAVSLIVVVVYKYYHYINTELSAEEVLEIARNKHIKEGGLWDEEKYYLSYSVKKYDENTWTVTVCVALKDPRSPREAIEFQKNEKTSEIRINKFTGKITYFTFADYQF